MRDSTHGLWTVRVVAVAAAIVIFAAGILVGYRTAGFIDSRIETQVFSTDEDL